MVVEGADGLTMLETTENRGTGIEIELVLEVMLDTTEKSAGGMETDVVVDVAEVPSLAVGVVEPILVLEADVVPELLAALTFELEAFVAASEPAEVFGLKVRVVDVVVEAAEVVSLEVRAAEVILELAGALVLDFDVINGVPDSTRLLNSDVVGIAVVVEFLEVLEMGAT